MANGNAVQFWGKEGAIQAYEFNKVPRWALFQGRDIIAKYPGTNIHEGADLLDQMITALQEGHSEAPYQLRMYEDDVKINDRSPYDYSFRFKLFADGEGAMGNPSSKIMQRLGAIEQRLSGGDQDDDEEEKAGGFQAAISGMLNKPEMQNFLMAKVFGFINSITGGAPTAPATIAGVPGAQDPAIDSNAAYMALPPQEKANLDKAMGILMSKDPQVGTHLLKLAQILASDPKKYNLYAGML